MIYRNLNYGNNHNLFSPTDDRALAYRCVGVFGPQPPSTTAWLNGVGTVIGPRLVITPDHMAWPIGTQFLYQGETYTVVKTTQKLTTSGCWYCELDRNVPMWAKLWRGQIITEGVTPVFYVCRGPGRGAPYLNASGVQVGWYAAGPETAAVRWAQYVMKNYDHIPSIPGRLPSAAWRFENENSECAGGVGGDSGGGAFVQLNGEWLFLGTVSGSSDELKVHWEYETWAAILHLPYPDLEWIDAQNAQWLPTPTPGPTPQTVPAGYPFITPGLDPTLLPQVLDECGLARWVSASQIKQMVEMARPGVNIGFVWVSSEAPPVAEDSAFKNFIWIDISTTWPYANREYNHATGSWDIVVPRPGSYTGDVFKDDSIGLGKLVPPGASNARKVLAANSNGTEYVWMYGRDTIGEKELSLSKLLIPASAPIGSYLTVVSQGVLGFSSLTSDKILNLIGPGSLTLSQLSTSGGLVKQRLGIDETDPKKWKFYTDPTSDGIHDGRILYTPNQDDEKLSSTTVHDDYKILAVKPGTTGYDAFDPLELPAFKHVAGIKRFYLRGRWGGETDPAPPINEAEHVYNNDKIFFSDTTADAVNGIKNETKKWYHGFGTWPIRWDVYLRYPSSLSDDPSFWEGFNKDQSIHIHQVYGAQSTTGAEDGRNMLYAPAYRVLVDENYLYITALVPRQDAFFYVQPVQSSDRIPLGVKVYNGVFDIFVEG